MPRYEENLEIGYAGEDLFSLVSDITQYPNFIKWIHAIRVRNKVEHRNGYTCDADVSVGFRGFAERFSTQVNADSQNGIVKATLLKGPMKSLQTVWKLSAQSERRCAVSFVVEYEFSNFMLRMLASANESLAAKRIMQAFLDEAERRFGPPLSS